MAFQVIPPRRLYQEIALQIKAHIESGEFSVGARLPAERELAQQLKVSVLLFEKPSLLSKWKA